MNPDPTPRSSDDPAPYGKRGAHILQFFSYAHLPEHLQRVSKPFCDLAAQLFNSLPENPETSVALRKLLESKDAAVRAVVAKGPVL